MVLAAVLRDMRALKLHAEYAEFLKEGLSCKFEYILSTVRMVIMVFNFYVLYKLQVKGVQKRFSEWQQRTDDFRNECKWLVFFSNMKLLQLHCFGSYDTEEQAERIVHEISVIFPNDDQTRASQRKYVKVHYNSQYYFSIKIMA